jgi:hypothetical protein
MSSCGGLKLWAPLLLAGAMIVGAGYVAPAEAHRNGCRVNGYNGHNGCRVNGFRASNGCRVNGFNGSNGCRVSGFRSYNGNGGVPLQRVRVYGWHTRLVPVSNGYNGFNGTYGFRGCNGYNGYNGYSGFNGYNGFDGSYGFRPYSVGFY